MGVSFWILGITIVAGMFLSIVFNKLTSAAAAVGGIVTVLIFIGSGYTGVVIMSAFFFIGVAVTSWKLNIKQKNGLAELNKGKRKAGQVLANAGLPALVGLSAWCYNPSPIPASLIIAACFASATADTVSSELGNIYGSRFYNIIGFKRSTRGLNGVVSLEGSLLGIAGSVIIAIIYGAGCGWSLQLIIIVVAGTIGNITDSVLGATLERKSYLNNDAVNFLNTCVAAVVAYLAYACL